MPEDTSTVNLQSRETRPFTIPQVSSTDLAQSCINDINEAMDNVTGEINEINATAPDQESKKEMQMTALEELKQKPDNQQIDLDKLKICVNSKRRNMKSKQREFLANFLDKDQTFQQI